MNNENGFILKNILICVALIFAAVAGSFIFTDHITQIVLMTIGLIFMIVARIIETLNIDKKERCSYTTFATITGQSAKTDSNGSTSYYPVYTYTYAGKEYTTVSSTTDSTIRKRIGDEVEIFLNPDDPEDSYIADYQKTIQLLQRVFQVIGIILLAAGAATLFL
ncbi:MAG: DUF3592 domain-containing protein [Erysipelotrichaceae bacterium]|nr:DUF3592 domain-containing protein [Erysipelotrichaceae bacterium]